MDKIGGNVTALIQVKSGNCKNEIGERIENWKTVLELTGFLDYSSGEAQRQNFNSKVPETTHIFISDYVQIENVTVENSRMIINGLLYDIKLIDNPMELHEQLEIYLDYTGGVINGN